MKNFPLIAAACALAATAAAQHVAPPAPAFAAPNLTPKAVAAMAANCAMCHGTEGRAAPGSAVVRLAGRPAEATAEALRAFRDGKREATVMHQIAKGFGDEEIAALAGYFARQRAEGS